MVNPWMTFTIRQKHTIVNMRLVALTLYRLFPPEKYAGRVEISEAEGKIVIQASGKTEADAVLKILDEDGIEYE